MGGSVVIIILLIVIVPVSIIMTGLLFSGLLGTVLQKEVDKENQGTELYDLSRKDFYQKPSS
tara:strand:+ start:516 stop:701 length:186 start_codon:yes stop_codon:yes gene_type:complete